MFEFKKKEQVTLDDYATRADFCRIFERDMESLYLLAFLLTGSHQLGEKCFVTALEGATGGSGVFKTRARFWSRRAVIKQAIRAVLSASSPMARIEDPKDEAWREPNDVLDTFREMPALERFAFVMSVLERYSIHDCCLLLGCAPETFIQARVDALQQLPALDRAWSRVVALPTESLEIA